MKFDQPVDRIQHAQSSKHASGDVPAPWRPSVGSASTWRLGLALPALAMFGACVSTEDAPATCRLDDFASPSIDTSVWGIYQQPPTKIEQRDGELVALLADRAAAYTSVYSIEELDFRGASTAVEVIQVPNLDGVEVLLQWVVNNRWRHFISAEAGRLYFGTQNDATYETRDVPYDPVAHRFWRLRHDRGRGKMIYETSADRESWIVERESDLIIPLDQAYVELAAGAYKEVEQPGTAAFDNFELAGACAP